MKIKNTFLAIMLAWSTSALSAQTNDVDTFLRTVDLNKIIRTDTPLNLGAQMKDPNQFTTDINEMSDFIGIGVKESGIVETILAEFDEQGGVLDKERIRSPWIGVAKFSQSEIPVTSLQQGYRNVRACVTKKFHIPAPEKIHRVIIYKTLNTSQVVYDFVFAVPHYAEGVCKEILYTPETDDCQLGFEVNCHETVEMRG